MRSHAVLCCLFLFCVAPLLLAEEPVDLQAITRIRDEGLGRSQVMDTTWVLTDRYGPRLTGSPNLRKAAEWARDRLTEWGLENAQLEEWGEFGRGWTFERVVVEMKEPTYMPMIAIPEAWTPGTKGTVVGAPIYIKVDSEEDLEKYKGKLSGKIVLMVSPPEIATPFEPAARRHDAEGLADLAKAPEPGARSSWSQRRGEWRARRALRQKITALLKDEGVAAILKPGTRRGDYGVVLVGSGGSRALDGPPGIPSIVVATEHYNRVVRLLEKKVPVELSVEVKTTFHTEHPQGFNVVAEIPGSDPRRRDEVVMLGAHFDSWHAGTGATDNGVSCAVIMEAARIIQTLDLRPRRTVRIALWTGEEQGLLGSAGYVKNHFADRQTMELKPEHGRLAAYFNIDNGGGKLRGIYCQSNAAVRPIFEAWVTPFNDLDCTTVTIRNTGGTDHLSYDRVGLPGFQFVQDPLDYSARTHHTNMDTYERVIPGDVMQASVILASFVYHAAMRDEMLPRKPLPKPRERERQRDRMMF